MFDILTGEKISAYYKFIQMNNTQRIIKFQTMNIDSALGFLQWYIRRYKKGLLLEIFKLKKIYDWKNKTIRYIYD